MDKFILLEWGPESLKNMAKLEICEKVTQMGVKNKIPNKKS